MARWKLATAHYINTPGIEWEYQEVDRATGRQVRRKFPVPMLLDPRDPSVWNNVWGPQGNQDGEIVVCMEGKGEPKDYVFLGDPTPDMIPVDDEAREISAGFSERWKFKADTEMPGSYSQSIVDQFQTQMSEIQSKPVEVPGLSELVQAITLKTQQDSALLEALVKRRGV